MLFFFFLRWKIITGISFLPTYLFKAESTSNNNNNNNNNKRKEKYYTQTNVQELFLNIVSIKNT